MHVVTTLEEKVKKLSIGLLLGLSGCLSYRSKLDSKYTVPSPLSELGQAYYSYDKEAIVVRRDDLIRENKFYRLRLIKICNKDSSNGLSNIHFYDVKCEGKTPLIIISPILWGKSLESHIFADYFASHGISAAVVNRIEQGIEDVLETEHFAVYTEDNLRRSVINIRRAIDYFKTVPDIDALKIGSFGISMGGIKNCLAASVDRRLKVNVFGITAQDIPHLFINSSEGMIERPRNRLLRRYPIESIQRTMRATLISDPMYFARSIDARNTLMIIALFDTVAPTEKQKELRKTIGNPETIFLPSGHYTSLLWIIPPFNYIQRQTLKFFQRKFAELDSIKY